MSGTHDAAGQGRTASSGVPPITDEQVRILSYRVPVALIANVIVAGAVVIVLHDWVPAETRFTWLALILIYVAARTVFWQTFVRAHPTDATPWGWKFTIANGISGVLWGAAAAVFYIPGHPALEVFLIIVVGGMGIGSLAVLTSYLPAFYAFFLPCMIPLAAVFFLQGGGYAFVMGGLVVALGVAAVVLAHLLNRLQRRSLQLDYENRGLIGTLSDANEAVQSADMAKSAFLASIGHELRTPLNAILGFSEIIRDELFGELNHPQYRDYARLVHNSAEHLLNVINEILDIAKAEGGKLEIEEEDMDAGRAIAICVSLITARAGAKAPRIGIDMPADLPRLRADPRRLKQILLNLLSNAAKFTPQTGEVRVRAGLEPSGGLAITVSDTGSGMTEDEIARATKLFARTEAALAPKFGGAGIGLPLTKALVELHGGRLDIESKPGAGTRVTVHFPKERVLPAGRPAPS